jgi:hypothetical protein
MNDIFPFGFHFHHFSTQNWEEVDDLSTRQALIVNLEAVVISHVGSCDCEV